MPVMIEVSVVKIVAGLARPVKLIPFFLSLPAMLAVMLDRFMELCFSPGDALSTFVVSIPCPQRRHTSYKKQNG